MKQAIILAGGKGTRLQERLKGMPKPLIDICGRPLLEHQIQLLKKFNFSNVILLVNYGAEQIEKFCTSKDNWGINIQCIDEGIPRGTAGAVIAAFDLLQDEFLIMYGDTMLEVDLKRFGEFHHSSPDVDATLFVHPNDHPSDSDLVEVNDESWVTAFHPYPRKEGQFFKNLVNAALYCLRRDALEPWLGNSGMLDFGKDIFPDMIRRRKKIRAYNSPEYIKDCGTPGRLDKVVNDYLTGRIKRSGLSLKQQAVFIDRDGVINKEMTHLSSPEQFELLPNVGSAIKRLTDAEYRTVVVTNQPVIARGECTHDVLRQIHNKMEGLLGKGGAYVDRIYYCPHHPDKGYEGEIAELKIDCDCRKPNIGMVERACEELNIDVKNSWIVGDTTVDVLTGDRAGLRSILVETGYAGLDGRHGVVPDFIVPDLRAAASFILEDFPKLMKLCGSEAKQIDEGEFVFIGGLSRSGKTNFANCLRYWLHSNGKRAVVLNIDRWLRDEGNRGEGVMGRYKTDEFGKLLAVISKSLEPFFIDLPVYDKLKRCGITGIGGDEIQPKDIVIVEGTIALLFAEGVEGRKSHKWFVEIDENEQIERVLKEYRLRGCSENDARSIFFNRQQDEIPVVLASAERASIKITLNIGCVSPPKVQHMKKNIS